MDLNQSAYPKDVKTYLTLVLIQHIASSASLFFSLPIRKVNPLADQDESSQKKSGFEAHQELPKTLILLKAHSKT